MTREEILSLIGAYATGTLSADERKALFEAALDDQELFDELAREQGLKELLDGPGVKERLATALAPRRRSRSYFSKGWVWGAGAAFAIAVIAGIVLFRTPPQQRELAQVIVPTTPLPPPIATVTPTPAPVTRTPARAIPAPTPTIPAPAASPPPPPRAPASPPPAGQTNDALVVNGTAAGALAAPPTARGGGGGGRGGAVVPRAMAPLARLAAPTSRLAFDYSVTAEGAFRIVPASNGFLSVGANNGSTVSILVDNRPLQAGSVTEVPLPADCVSAIAIFSVREVPAGSLNITGPMDPPSGTKLDPNPTPDSRLIAVVPTKR